MRCPGAGCRTWGRITYTDLELALERREGHRSISGNSLRVLAADIGAAFTAAPHAQHPAEFINHKVHRGPRKSLRLARHDVTADINAPIKNLLWVARPAEARAMVLSSSAIVSSS
jgi:hypothetical protein